MIEKVYKGFLTIFGDVKVFPAPLWVVYNPKGYEVRGSDVRTILNTLQTGDILVRKYNNYLDGYFIPGYFSHAGFYAGNDQVIHAMAEGVKKEDVINFFRCDDAAIIRFEDPLTAAEMTKAVDKAYEFVGTKYDFWFDFEDASDLSCTELVYQIYKDLGWERFPIRPKVVTACFGLMKKRIIGADDYVSCPTLRTVYRKRRYK